MPSIGLVANVYNEVNALAGWLETHLPFFDDVRVLHAGPNGEASNDGTMELLEKWRIPVHMDSINDGFGRARSRAIHISPCDYVMILDADERFFPTQLRMTCTGEDTLQSEVDMILQSYDFRDATKPPNWDLIGTLGSKLTVNHGESYDQGAALRKLLNEYKPGAVTSIRRHWHDFRRFRPTQNWYERPDWQNRIVRRTKSTYYFNAMHEQLIVDGPIFPPYLESGPFFDHFHFHFKRMEGEQRAHDIQIYDAIHGGQVPPTVKEFELARLVREVKEQRE